MNQTTTSRVLGRRVQKLFASSALLALSASACVKRTEYDALSQKHTETLQTLAAKEDELKAQNAALERAGQAQSEGKRLSAAALADLKAQLEASQRRQVELQDQITQMVRDGTKLKASIEDMQKALAAVEAQRKETEARIAEYKRLIASFKKLIDAGKLRVKVVSGRMVIELPSDILFASGSIEVSNEGTAALTEVGKVFASMRDRKFQVDGHTDDQPIRTARFPNNWALAAGRAIAVTEVLIKAKVAPENLSAASFGEFRPVASNAKPEGRKQNRRIEIVLVPDLSKVPGFGELEKAASK